ncbi:MULTISPECIES: SDR family NAD(P)-dependent oxidoreductase [Corallincola]|uniref:SDR family NAD(P)-dependent oxidoreductase n=3 Tax=Corallincola TaxID=1775176 RepID=A0A368NJH3_9GAMM|nr:MULTISPECIES: SDR family oxidoreductase [Corallincola]RCU49511.1 SDR family NAD(P)-dependent oxidoreductase [Corallincola holothuriorum]TAA47806.1 SDR family oxidoreductase [Corallincola spongiicola]TCI02051.1 SDR family oxidoreductase [Corallincola luteus]
MANLDNKVVLVTGSTKGIGLAIAQSFADKGCRVIVHGRDAQQAAQVCLDIKGYASVAGDLSSANACDEVLQQLSHLDDVEYLVNNAGIFSVADFFAIDDDEWLRYYQTNVLSVVRLCRALMPGMLARDSGGIINVASEAGYKPLPQMIHYSVSKTALTGLSRGLAELTKGTNVTVNTLLPGPTWTAGVEEYFAGLAKEEGRPLDELVENYFQEHEPNSLIQRFITIEEVADAAVFVAGNGAVNGSALRVEGGIIRSI